MKRFLLFIFIIILPIYIIQAQYETLITANGFWSDPFVWNGPAAPSDGVCDNDVTIGGHITLDTSLVLDGGYDLIVSDTLIVTGNMSADGSLLPPRVSNITVLPDGLLIVLGDLYGNHSLLDIQGDFVVMGNVILDNLIVDPLDAEDGNAYFYDDDVDINPGWSDNSDVQPDDSIPSDLLIIVDDLVISYLLSTAPTLASADNEQFCDGTLTDIILSYSGGSLGSTAIARWYSDPAFTILEGSGQDLTIVAPTVTTTYYVRYEGYDTTSAVSVVVQVDNTLGAIGVVTGTATLCAGTTGQTYSVTPQAGATYTWTVPAGASITSGQGTSSIDVTFGATSGNISVTLSNACGSVGPQDLAITVNAVPALSTTTTPAICNGDSYNLTSVVVTDANTTGATYTYHSGTPATAGNELASTTVSPASTTTYYILGTTGSGCTDELGVELLVLSSAPLDAGPISGNNFVCQGETGVSYSIGNITNAVEYVWSYSGTGAIISGNGASITLDFAVDATNGDLIVFGRNDCADGGSSSISIIVNTGAPADAGSITGSDNVCQGENSLTYSIPVINEATNYNWTYSGTGADLTITNNTVLIDFASDATSGQLSVEGSNSCGTGNASTLDITVNTGAPASAGTITGSSNVCQGTSSVAYSIDPITNAVDYVWTFNGTGATINSSQNSITIDFDNNATSGELVVFGRNTCGDGQASSIALTLNSGIPGDAGSITGVDNVCQGEASVIYSIPAINNATEYLWTYTGTGTLINGMSNSISIDFDALATSGELTVQGNNGCGTGTISEAFLIRVNGLPGDAGTIDGESEICQGQMEVNYEINPISNADEYIWEYSGSGATLNGTSEMITINFDLDATDGILSVYGLNICGQGNSSADYPIVIKSIDECAESELGEISNVFTPNNDGVHETWEIKNIELFPNAKIEVFDRWGRKVFVSENGYNNDWNGTFDGNPLPMDNYFYVIDLLGNGEKVLNGNITILK